MTKSTHGQTEFTLDALNSSGIIGTPEFDREGGTFNFKVSYTDKKTTKNSPLSAPFQVVVSVKKIEKKKKGTPTVVKNP